MRLLVLIVNEAKLSQDHLQQSSRVINAQQVQPKMDNYLTSSG